MIYAVVGAGGKTSLIHEMAAKFRAEGKSVFVTTTTHMFLEEHTLCTDDAATITSRLQETGFVMAGIPEGIKIKSLSAETYEAVCRQADVVLVEADGSKCLPFKFPNATEPVIPANADEILVVCGIHALGQKAKDCCHRLNLVMECLGIQEDTILTPAHAQQLAMEGYVKPLREKYPNKKITLVPRHDGSLYQRTLASLLQQEQDVTAIRAEWFAPQPRLIICGGGHVAKEVAAMAAHLDFHTRIIDDRADLMIPERFPTTEEVICDRYANIEQYLEPGAYYVVVTPDHKEDYRCVCAILNTHYAYLGMIGSRRKVATFKEKLQEDGFTQAQISSIFAPIGLPIGAVTPAEIAISILAQIIQEKNKTHAASADRSLLEAKEPGVLCIITGKQGSSPRGVGSMMFVGKDRVLGSIGGGESEYLAIAHARETTEITTREYRLNNRRADGLDMVCGGTIQVLFIPV